MVSVLRIIGLIFWILAFLLFVIEILLLLSDFSIAAPLGQVWFQISPSGLNLTQAIIQRYLFPGLWNFIFIPFLNMAVWKSLTALVLIFIVAGTLLRNLQDKKRFFRR